jgi:hypothetical protein
LSKGKRRHDKKGRSEGQTRFVQFPYWLLESQAALDLSGTAFKVLVYVLKRFNGTNNGQIGFGARSGCFVRDPKTGRLQDVPIGIRPRTMSDALAEIEHRGFLVCTKVSTFDQKRRTKEWRLTWLPADNHPATKEFVTASPIQKAKRKQKPGRHTALSTKLQSGTPLYGPMTQAQDTLYRAAHRPMADADRAAHRPHLVTIPGAADALSKARALSERRALAASAARSSALKFSSKATAQDKPSSSGGADAA